MQQFGLRHTMRFAHLFILLCVTTGLLACTSEKETFHFTSSNQSLILSKKDIKNAELKQDLQGRHFVEILLTKESIRSLARYTADLTGKTMTVQFDEKVIYQNIPVWNELNMERFALPVRDKNEGLEIVNSYKRHPKN